MAPNLTQPSGIPGALTPGTFVPGDAGNGSGQYLISTTPVLVMAAPSGIRRGASAWFSATVTAGAPVYLGASNLTSSNGAALAAGGTVSGFLFPGDQVYALTASGTSTLSVLQG